MQEKQAPEWRGGDVSVAIGRGGEYGCVEEAGNVIEEKKKAMIIKRQKKSRCEGVVEEGDDGLGGDGEGRGKARLSVAPVAPVVAVALALRRWRQRKLQQ